MGPAERPAFAHGYGSQHAYIKGSARRADYVFTEGLLALGLRWPRNLSPEEPLPLRICRRGMLGMPK